MASLSMTSKLTMGVDLIEVRILNLCPCLVMRSFILKLDDPVRKTFEEYAEDCGFEFYQLTFRFKNEVIQSSKTPKELKMNHGSMVFVEHNRDLLYKDVSKAFIKMKNKSNAH
ncbi:unnamed protein product [Orchesella dallaii]|uniref:Uncharacterized protein n=1 Tax=Orchesella dallaii TaxID=48710 RepID=A0ABP1QPF2_9HEXA